MPTVRLNYKRIHYRDAAPTHGGAAKGTVVLAHGLGSSQNYYLPVTPALTAAGYRCVTFDMTGSGRSPYTHVEQSVRSLAGDILGLMDALAIPEAVLVGHSMSGMTVPQAAAQAPGRVRGVVLFGAVWPSEAVAPVFEERIARVESEGMESMGETVPFAAVAAGAPALQRAFVREVVMGSDPAGYVSLCRVIADAYRDPPDYAGVRCPALIVVGEEDKSGPPEHGRKIYAALGTEEGKKVFEEQKGIGHWMCVEDGDDCARRMLAFFDKMGL